MKYYVKYIVFHLCVYQLLCLIYAAGLVGDPS